MRQNRQEVDDAETESCGAPLKKACLETRAGQDLTNDYQRKNGLWI